MDSSSKILRYGAPSGDPRVAGSVSAEIIEAHIRKYIGDPTLVLHEIGSRYVHVDVHVVPPQPGRDFYTFITSGMSDRPMNVPAQAQGFEFAELLLCLPSNWKMKEYDVMSGASWAKDWPLISLRHLARFPHEYNTWVSWGHSIPNGDPAIPFSSETRLCGWVVLEPQLAPPQFRVMKRKDGKRTLFYAVVPVYQEETDLKLREGAERLQELFIQRGITELVDLNRASAVVM